MIVVDTNVVAYLHLPSDRTAHAERLLKEEPDWVVPPLWRSELRNVLTLHMRQRLLTFEEAIRIQRRAEDLLSGAEHAVDSFEVLALARDSGCSAYDCEFIALAVNLQTQLVTADAKLLKAFPKLTRSLTPA